MRFQDRAKRIFDSWKAAGETLVIRASELKETLAQRNADNWTPIQAAFTHTGMLIGGSAGVIIAAPHIMATPEIMLGDGVNPLAATCFIGSFAAMITPAEPPISMPVCVK